MSTVIIDMMLPCTYIVLDRIIKHSPPIVYKFLPLSIFWFVIGNGPVIIISAGIGGGGNLCLYALWGRLMKILLVLFSHDSTIDDHCDSGHMHDMLLHISSPQKAY